MTLFVIVIAVVLLACCVVPMLLMAGKKNPPRAGPCGSLIAWLPRAQTLRTLTPRR